MLQELGLRRDGRAHRGPMLQYLGTASFVCGAAALCFPPLGLVAVSLGGVVLALANGDLSRMEDGSVDPRGQKQTVGARGSAISGLGFGIISLFLWGVILISLCLPKT